MAQKHQHDDGQVVTETVPKQKLKRPTLYKEIFHKSETDAVQIMMHVHYNGIGVAGVYTYDVADTKLKTVEAAARDNGFPLRLSMEPEEG
ncbi:MAG: ATP-dependent Clp protease adaptor ClpS [Myxococcaceae bacterium]|nr:MAG: ATP-dependent Clp protease adaptor ClpS [Myxococcaceae bacterium]